MTAAINTKPSIGDLRHGARRAEPEEIPLGALVRTPLGLEARVVAYRGIQARKGPGRSHRVWLVCKYVRPVNQRFSLVQLLPELVEILEVNHGP